MFFIIPYLDGIAINSNGHTLVLVVYRTVPHTNEAVTTGRGEGLASCHSNTGTFGDIGTSRTPLGTLGRTTPPPDWGTAGGRGGTFSVPLLLPTDGYTEDGIDSNTCYSSIPTRMKERRHYMYMYVYNVTNTHTQINLHVHVHRISLSLPLPLSLSLPPPCTCTCTFNHANTTFKISITVHV